jgi:hypothetical protein
MAEVVYRIVEHDGGWAYTALGVFSETYPSHQGALAAARRAAAEQGVSGETKMIEYETEDGQWLTERAEGGDRPRTRVED